jgi:hypothetical protein
MKTPPLVCLTTSLLVLIGLIACDRRPRADDDAAARADARRLEELRAAERNAAEREAAARDAEQALARRRADQESATLKQENAALAARAKEAEEAAAQSRATAEVSAQRSAEAAPEQTLDFFYDALDPHGDWIEIADYGFAWKPRAGSDSRWRPYLDGHWAWTDYGWTWVSNEPFGWATYHYGRWTRIKRLGWVWVPGSEWAPAWVAWRSNDRLVGWAPLPPEAYSGSGFSAAVDDYYDIGPGMYAFVAIEAFGEPTYLGKMEEPAQNVTIVNQTVNVTNIKYRNVQNKTVVHNDGPSLNVINRQSRTQIKTVKLERGQSAAAAADAGKVERDGVLHLRAPQIRSAAKPAGGPKHIKERARREEVDRGWSEADPDSAKKVKEHQAREARRAEAEEIPAAVSPAATAAPTTAPSREPRDAAPPATSPPDDRAPRPPKTDQPDRGKANRPDKREGEPRRGARGNAPESRPSERRDEKDRKEKDRDEKDRKDAKAAKNT